LEQGYLSCDVACLERGVELTHAVPLLGVLDRRDKDAITLLFAAVPNNSSTKVKQNNREIERAEFSGILTEESFAIPSIRFGPKCVRYKWEDVERAIKRLTVKEV